MGAAELEAPLPAADRIVPGPYRVCFLRKSFIAVPVFRLKRAQRPDGALKPILSNPVIFAVNLYETPLAEKIERNFREMLVPGGVRASLKKI